MLNHFSGVMAGQQPVEDGRERPYVPAIPPTMPCKVKDVDGRDRHGHDDVEKLMIRNPKALAPGGYCLATGSGFGLSASELR